MCFVINPEICCCLIHSEIHFTPLDHVPHCSNYKWGNRNSLQQPSCHDTHKKWAKTLKTGMQNYLTESLKHYTSLKTGFMHTRYFIYWNTGFWKNSVRNYLMIKARWLLWKKNQTYRSFIQNSNGKATNEQPIIFFGILGQDNVDLKCQTYLALK